MKKKSKISSFKEFSCFAYKKKEIRKFDILTKQINLHTLYKKKNQLQISTERLS
jgi:hypothetical protein